jgi:protein-S-isoprenylcysteine O-methyltransferase Ste14
MYAGVLLAILGQGWLFGSMATVEYLVAMAVLFHLFVLLYEEPALGRKFGASYQRYCETVPRWVPGTRLQAGPGA